MALGTKERRLTESRNYKMFTDLGCLNVLNNFCEFKSKPIDIYFKFVILNNSVFVKDILSCENKPELKMENIVLRYD